MNVGKGKASHLCHILDKRPDNLDDLGRAESWRRTTAGLMTFDSKGRNFMHVPELQLWLSPRKFNEGPNLMIGRCSGG